MLPRRRRDTIRWCSRTLSAALNPLHVRQFFGRQPGCAILESVATHPRWGRFSLYARQPACILSTTPCSSDPPLDALSRFTRPWRCLRPETELPFVGGWIGFLSYEAGRWIEPTAGWIHRAGPLPLSRWALYDTVLVHDQVEATWTICAIDLPEGPVRLIRPPPELRLDRLEGELAALPADELPAAPPPENSAGTWNYSRSAYLAKVRRALDYIRAGDVFQVNVARRFRQRIASAPPALYEALCRHNPAPYAAFLRLDGSSPPGGPDATPSAILSSSPELFLSLRRGEVVTRPIKGTRPRGRDAAGDDSARAELAASPKERAELNMIIDLERNDLGRVCEFGSVHVEDEGRIEPYPTVFHRVATVRGRLAGSADPLDLLAATFPGGSVTGAPKVRAMQIIHRLEPHARGPYCGAIGWIGLDGDMRLNLAIRTVTLHAGVASFHVGSGIVADSDPERELEELDAKAEGMRQAFNAAAPPGPPATPASPSRRAGATAGRRSSRARQHA